MSRHPIFVYYFVTVTLTYDALHRFVAATKDLQTQFESNHSNSQGYAYILPVHTRRIVVGLAVSNAETKPFAGDIFTALDFAEAMINLTNWDVKLLPEGEKWYNLSGIDLLVVLLHKYDLRKISYAEPSLITVAWMRNWISAWLEQPWFSSYDLGLASSTFAVQWIASQSTGVPTELLRLATNPTRFYPAQATTDFTADYAFTGSYWGVSREIFNFNPKTLNYTGAYYGHGLNAIEILEPVFRGTLPYENVVNVYQSVRVVIDDSNHVTRPWGSLNSRVFDAVACGANVITNNLIGAKEVFGTQFPTWTTADELRVGLDYLLKDDERSLTMGQHFREVVLKQHTYNHRTLELRSILDSHFPHFLV